MKEKKKRKKKRKKIEEHYTRRLNTAALCLSGSLLNKSRGICQVMAIKLVTLDKHVGEEPSDEDQPKRISYIE
jgi:hypothetical protein